MSGPSLKRHLPFQPALEGLRGLAVLAVLLFHAEVPGLGGGFLGVSTFFTLSGFLITGLLVAEREHEGHVHLRAFWARRFRRLMPAAFLGLLFILVLGSTFGDFPQQQRLRFDGLASLFYLANWWMIYTGAAYADLMGSPSFLQHFWSLAIEEQFYAVFPPIAAALLALGGRRALAILLGAATLASWGWTFELGGSSVTTARIYYGTDTRCAELLIGGLLALWLSDRRHVAEHAGRFAALGAVGLAASVCFWVVATVESPWLYRGGLVLYGLASASVVAGCIAPSGPVRLGLAWTPLRWIGRVSYGAYVYHWPIFLVVDKSTGLDPWSLFVLRVVLTFGCAAASYRWLEEPILARRLLGGWRSVVVACSAFFGLAYAFVKVQPDIDMPMLPEKPVALVAGAARIAIVGDSVADDVGDGLVMWAARTGEAEILNLAIRGCGLAVGAWPESVGRRPLVCDRWRERVRPRLEEFRPDVIVAVTAVWELNSRELPEWGRPRALGDPVFDAWLSEELETASSFLASFDAPVVWLTAPCIRRIEGGTQGAFDPARLSHLNGVILPGVAERNPEIAELVDFHEAVCPGGRFTTQIYGIQPFRSGGVHFTERAQHWIGEWLGPRIQEAREATP